MKISGSSRIYNAIYHMVVIYCYLEGDNNTVFKFRMGNSYLEISASLFQAPFKTLFFMIGPFFTPHSIVSSGGLF